MLKKSRFFRDLVKVLNYWLPPLIWGLIIFSFSAHSTPSVSSIYWQEFVFKKAVHVAEYAIFTLLVYRGFKGFKCKSKRALLYSFLIAVFYGITDEFHQAFTPGRESKVIDILFDGTGSFVIIFLISKVLPTSNQEIKKVAKYLDITY